MNINAPKSMIVTRNYTDSFYVGNWLFPADAYIELSANITSDLQNGYVISVNSYSTYAIGYGTNFDYWEETSVSYNENTPSNGTVRFSVSGRAHFSKIDPDTYIRTTYIKTVSNKQLDIYCI